LEIRIRVLFDYWPACAKPRLLEPWAADKRFGEGRCLKFDEGPII
jgi:hypothetical protein